MSLDIDIWSDIACPWCFIGKRRFEKALAAFPHRDRVGVTWHSFQLDPGLPERSDLTEREYLAQRKGFPAAQVDQMLSQVTAVAAGEGLHYDFDALVVANSRKAHRLLHAVKRAGLDVGAAKEALLSAHFERGEDTSDDDVLAGIGVAAGLAEAAARAALTDPDLEAAVAADIDEARELGIGGVPFFVLHGKYGISGAQPTELFAQALAQVWAETQPAEPALITIPGAEGAPACGPDGCA